MPAHADNISIDLDTTTVTLQRSGNLYKHNSSVRVRNSNTYGFTLSMHANQPNLVNDKDSTYKIGSVSGTNQQLAANQWGYGMGKDATTFNSVSSATLADVTSYSKGNCTSVDDCTLYLTFGANLDQKRLPTGSYSTSLTYTATSKPAPYVPPAPTPEPPAPEPYVPPEPPKPKWTTNGCYYSGDNWHNCSPFSEPGNTTWVVWRGDAWYAIKPDMWESWFNYNNYNTTWAHAAILTESGKQKYESMYGDDSSAVKYARLDLDDIVKIFAYVPVYAKRGRYIDFCGSIDDKCKYNNVTIDHFDMDYFNLAIDYSHDDGFWISAYAMGCTNAPDESKCKDSDYHYDCNYLDILSRPGEANKYRFPQVDSIRSDAKKVANTLAEALGSPCY